VKLVPLETPLQANNAYAVEIIEEYLAMAKRGELEAVAIVGLRPDGSCTYVWSSTERFTVMAGGIAVLQHRLIADHT
jgi:hypothetical protein